MRAETQEAMRMFFGDVATRLNSSKKDHLSEVAGYSDDRQAPQRAAWLAAAVKRYKTSEMLRFILPPSRMILTRSDPALP